MKKTFYKAINSDDIEMNGKVEVTIHGMTVFAWTKKRSRTLLGEHFNMQS